VTLTGEVVWQQTMSGKDIDDKRQLFSPPALGAKNAYFVTSTGHLLALDRATGQLKFAYKFALPISMQPILAKGMIYLTTTKGELIALATDEDADGWTQWGGSAGHNTSAK
jgi:outer membrane protein assembly factor BamB